jgi:hypothetical protein
MWRRSKPSDSSVTGRPRKMTWSAAPAASTASAASFVVVGAAPEAGGEGDRDVVPECGLQLIERNVDPGRVDLGAARP